MLALYTGPTEVQAERVAVVEAAHGLRTEADLAFVTYVGALDMETSWQMWLNGVKAVANALKPVPRTPVITLPLFPSPFPPGAKGQPGYPLDTPLFTQVLTEVADGRHDKRFGAAADLLLERLGGRKVFIRLAHECNGDWYQWTIRGQDPALWIRAWRRGATALRSWRPAHNRRLNAELVWNTTRASWNHAPLESYFPGADLVDVIGIDVYDHSEYGYRDPARRWTEVLTPIGTNAWGLSAADALALRHGTSIAVCEWGLSRQSLAAPPAPANAAAFITAMGTWLAARRTRPGSPLAYHTLWTFNANDGGTSWADGRSPLAEAAVRASFGSVA